MTTGLKIGAASMKVTAAAGCSPRSSSRRATGTDPHSHTGNARPAAAAPGTWSAAGRRPRRANARSGT